MLYSRFASPLCYLPLASGLPSRSATANVGKSPDSGSLHRLYDDSPVLGCYTGGARSRYPFERCYHLREDCYHWKGKAIGTKIWYMKILPAQVSLPILQYFELGRKGLSVGLGVFWIGRRFCQGCRKIILSMKSRKKSKKSA